MKTILVTGGTGFVGQSLIQGLSNHGYSIVLLVRGGKTLTNTKKLLRVYDTDEYSLNKAFELESIDCIIHLASSYGRNGEISDVIKTNICFAIDVLNAALKHNVNHFINTDSFFRKYLSNQSYLSEYTLTKIQFLEWLKLVDSQINVINMVLHHVYGPNDSKGKFFPWLIGKYFNTDLIIELTSCGDLRDFVYIDDVVDAYLLIVMNLKSITGFVEFDVGTGIVISVKDVVCELDLQMKAIGLGKDKKILFGALKNKGIGANLITPDVEGLRSLGWIPKFNIKQGLQNYIKFEVNKFK
jgi:CDP-paratose synthetase